MEQTRTAIRIAGSLNEQGSLDAALLVLNYRMDDLDRERKAILEVMARQGQLMNRPSITANALINEAKMSSTPEAMRAMRDEWREKGYDFAQRVADELDQLL